MNQLKLLVQFACVGMVLFVVSPASGQLGKADQAKRNSHAVEPGVVVQTAITFTRTLEGERPMVICTPKIRAFAGVPASIEIETEQGEKFEIRLVSKVMPVARQPKPTAATKPESR